MRSFRLRRFAGNARLLVGSIFRPISYAVATDGDAFPREGLGVSYGLNWALAGRGIMIKDKAFHNLNASDLHQKGATTAGLCEIIGIRFREKDGFLVADIERSSLRLCGKGFADTYSVKDTLAAIAAPVISARKGIPLSARLYTTGGS